MLIRYDSLNRINFKKLASQQKSIQMKMKYWPLLNSKMGTHAHKSPSFSR
ncbi:hypothetical protein D024_3197 [Vibrio parahaemolyticus 3259]|nr:hypothetical protein D024_3197 [Vibrio parahaemolyticus 3259]ETJ84927.1 hypothetical protein D041_4921 [Vibrio parahaemolyticus EKP-008]